MASKHLRTNTVKNHKKNTKKVEEENRLYVIVAEEIHIGRDKVWMEPGRMAAQACHVTGKFREGRTYQDITTIVLTARNNKELDMLARTLAPQLDFWEFRDHNPEFYKKKDRVLTALCFYAKPTLAQEFIAHLPLM
jgi:hypothetical protein